MPRLTCATISGIRTLGIVAKFKAMKCAPAFTNVSAAKQDSVLVRSFQALRTISRATTTDRIGSIGVQPV